METDQGYGSRTPTPFAYYDRDTSSWRTCQGSLLEDSGEFCTTWPKQGTWDAGFAYELPTSGLPIFASGYSSLLPTPQAADGTGGRVERSAAANGWRRPSGSKASKPLGTAVALLPTPQSSESTPTDEFLEEVEQHLGDPHTRLYLPGRKWHVQRTLSRIAPALLPTPGANDHTGPEGETRRARQEEGSTGGPSLRDLPKMLPTPMGNDWKGGMSGQFQLSDAARLLPTPVANPDNPGAGGELRAALTHGPERRNETGIDTMGRPNTGRPSRLLPTPTAEDGERGQNADAARKGPSLRGAVNQQLLPTPTEAANRKSTKAMMSSEADPENRTSSPPGLEQVAEMVDGRRPHDLPADEDLPPATRRIVESLLPTPTVQDGENTAGPSQLERNSLPLNAVVTRLPTPGTRDHHAQGAGRNPAASATQLSTVIQKYLPTPTAQAAKHGETEDVTANGHGFNLWDVPHLLPTSTGESTPALSSSGSGSAESSLPVQLTIGDA